MKVKNPNFTQKPQPNWEGAKSKLTALLSARGGDAILDFEALRDNEPALRDWPDGHIHALCDELGLEVVPE